MGKHRVEVDHLGWLPLPGVHGVDGVALARQEKPDAVLMDIVAMQVKEIETISIFRYANDYERSIALIASGQINVKPLISKKIHFNQSIQAFELAASAPADVIKIIIDFDL